MIKSKTRALRYGIGVGREGVLGRAFSSHTIHAVPCLTELTASQLCTHNPHGLRHVLFKSLEFFGNKGPAH